MARRAAVCGFLALVGACVAAPGVPHADIVQAGNLRVSFSAETRPKRRPRHGLVPISMQVSGKVATTDGRPPPQLRTITIAISRHGRIDTAGLPRCHYGEIQPASTDEAYAACRRSLIGSGRFEAAIALPEQSPFPSDGTMLAFNGTLHGRQVIFAHIYGRKPLPISRVIVFRLRRIDGTYGYRLSAQLPSVAAEWGYVSGVQLRLGRTFAYRGHRRSFLQAGCPAPAGFSGGVYPLALASFHFDGGRTLRSVLSDLCRVR